MMITLLNKNISVLLTKNLNFNPLVLRHASYSINTNIIKSKNFESFSHLKPRETSNLTIFLVNKKDFSIFKQKFQSRQEKSSESGKILTSLSLDNRKSNDDQVSTNVRPAEKGYLKCLVCHLIISNSKNLNLIKKPNKLLKTQVTV